MSRLVWPFAVGGLAAVALGLFGWWAPTSGTASAPPGAGPGAPDGRELVIGLPSPRGPLSPLITGRSDARDLLSTFVIQPFLAIDPVGQLTPVTTTATVDLERQEVRLRLLGGVRFHAHPTCLEARPATPDDVLASIHLAREMATANFENVQPDQARVEGEEVVVPFSSNRGDEVYELDWVRLLPLEIARDRCDDPFDLAFPVGTGTHRLAAPPAGEALTLVRVDGADSPFARIRTVPVRDLKEALKLIDKGELDLYRDWVPASLSELIEQREGRLALREGALPPLQRPVQMLPWGLRNHFGVVGIIPRRDRAGPLAERRVRQAVALAIDPAPLKTGLAYMERPEKRFLQPWMLGYDPELEPLPVDRARARALLAGRESPIQIVLEVGASGKGAAPVLIEQLAEVGIEVTLVEGDAPGNAVLATSAAPMQGVDPTRALFSFVVAIGQATPPGERVRPALDAAGQARRQEDKRRALRDLEAALLEELPMMPIGLARRDPLFGTMVASERLAPLTEGGEDFVGLVIREYAPRTLRWADAP